MSDSTKDVEIKINGKLAQVFVNGQEIRNITAYRLIHQAWEEPILQLDVVATKPHTVKGKMQVEVREIKI